MYQNKEEKWTATWGNAMSIADRRPAYYAKDVTLRYPIVSYFDGSAVRVTLDNYTGTEDVTITKVCAMTKDGTVYPITFDGAPSVTIPAGERIISDGTEMKIARKETFYISIYLGEFTLMRSGVRITGPLSKGQFSVGDHTEHKELPLDLSKGLQWFYFLSDVDVMTAQENHTIICYGDSITAQSWPDYVGKSLLAGENTTTAVIRKAASGTRVLRQYDNITYDSYGLQGCNRVPRELEISGADTVLIQQGINDIIHPVGTDVNPFRPWSDLPTAEELIDGLRMYIREARNLGMKVYMGTLLPIEGWRTYADFREVLRGEINEWIRTTDEIDGCVDFDQAVCNPQHPTAFAPGFDSGDHLHPSESAYRRMAECAVEALDL